MRGPDGATLLLWCVGTSYGGSRWGLLCGMHWSEWASQTSLSAPAIPSLVDRNRGARKNDAGVIGGVNEGIWPKHAVVVRCRSLETYASRSILQYSGCESQPGVPDGVLNMECCHNTTGTGNSNRP